ncbi:MAG: SPASM domain-containing protein [Elusimicrobiota bacterium]
MVAKDGLALLPDATVLPCRRFNIPVGNLQTDSLENIWSNSKLLNDLRNKQNLKGKCGKCGVSDCIGCRAMVYALTGDYLAEDFHCWL